MPKDYPNFESIISGFLSKLELATKSDVHSLMNRIDDLEQLIESVVKNSDIRPVRTKKTNLANPRISDQIIDILGKNGSPMTYAQLKEISGFDEKSLRNVIYRLNKLGRIETVRRGHYKISNSQDKKLNDS